MKKENCVKIGTFLFLILIIFFIYLILYLYKKDNRQMENTPYNMQVVTEYGDFFSVVNNINQYFFYNSSKNNTAFYELLNKEYTQKNNIVSSNVFTKLEVFENSPIFKALYMYYEENENNILYYVIGNIIISNYDEIEIIKKDVKFFVLVDYDTMAFSIYPFNENTDEIPIQNKTQTISLNDYNGIRPTGTITKDYICSLYYSDFIEKLFTNPKEIYDVLEEKFKSKYYEKEEKFLQYVNQSVEKFSLDIKDCQFENKNNKRIYTIYDLNNNVYTFEEQSIMNYTLSFNIK